MEVSKLSMIIVLGFMVFILLAYIFYLKKEIRNISKQLKDYNKLKTQKKININLIDKDIERLANNINNHIDMHIQVGINQKNSEDELKRAITNISHDIRTPLTAILGYIQMSKSKKISSHQRLDYITIAESRAKSLKSILEKFFSLSLIQSPEYILEIEPININNVLYEVISSYYDIFNEKNIEPKIDIKEENIIVMGNQLGINRIIDNLITNLIKYSSGEESILLKKKDDKCILIISNEVKNIKEGDVKLFFDRFYKQDLSRNSNESSGLGLYIVKKLIEKMQGSIEVKLKNDKIYLICTWIVI